jgi:hypothetical protein
VRVRPDSVDLTAHTGLVALSKELRACAGSVRALKVRSKCLEALPAWLEKLTGLTELRVDGMGLNFSLKELPDAVGQLTTLRTLELRGCPGVNALPQGLTSLTGLEDLLLMHCTALRVPAWVTALTGLRVPFEEWRLRVRSDLRMASQGLTGWLKLFPRTHIEKMEGSFMQNEKYCSKESTLIKFGIPPAQGSRNDLLDVKDLLVGTFPLIIRNTRSRLRDMYFMMRWRGILIYSGQ